MKKKSINIPSASVLINSMRSMGYTFESAMSDLIDNSITAKAKNIYIETFVDEGIFKLVVLDDGLGMDKETLFDAMKYGSKENVKTRNKNDLGKFGLGLKTASISQCKKFTVITKQKSEINNLCWDIDEINKSNNWTILSFDNSSFKSNDFFKRLSDKKSGTAVIWENFDIIQKKDGYNIEESIADYLVKTKEHLSLIYHRFLTGSFNKLNDFNKVNIFINNVKVEGIDPFLEKHKKTNHRKEIEIPISSAQEKHIVYAKPYVLPFIKDISEIDFKQLGGKKKFIEEHGFYIYRNERLIIWGTWYNLQKVDGFTKNVRIKVDIPNSLDHYWSIDVKKQNAILPSIIRKNLVSKIEESSGLAAKINKHRGRIANKEEKNEYIWNRLVDRGKISYRINKSNVIFKTIYENVNDDSKKYILKLIDLIESSVPYQSIFNDFNEDIVNDNINFNTDELEILFESMIDYYKKTDRNLNVDFILRKLEDEPFKNDEELKKRILKRYENEIN
jgi:hypothetical protein